MLTKPILNMKDADSTFLWLLNMKITITVGVWVNLQKHLQCMLQISDVFCEGLYTLNYTINLPTPCSYS